MFAKRISLFSLIIQNNKSMKRRLSMNQKIDTDIQSFVFKNFVQQQQRGEFELHGYYKSKKKKIIICNTIFEHINYLKIQKQDEKHIKMRKAKKLINFQLCFLQTLLEKFSECFRIKEGIDIPQFKFYNYLHKSIIYNIANSFKIHYKFQILSMVTCSQIIIQRVNLEQMIANVFRTWNLKYFKKIKQHEIPETIKQLQDSGGNIINSSQIHLELLLHIVAIALRKLLFNYEEFILIELEQYEEIFQLNFYFNSKKHIQKITFLKENLGKQFVKWEYKRVFRFKKLRQVLKYLSNQMKLAENNK